MNIGVDSAKEKLSHYILDNISMCIAKIAEMKAVHFIFQKRQLGMFSKNQNRRLSLSMSNKWRIGSLGA
jgi:hypothetical protein